VTHLQQIQTVGKINKKHHHTFEARVYSVDQLYGTQVACKRFVSHHQFASLLEEWEVPRQNKSLDVNIVKC
jgi:hypothetical protein